MGRAAARVHSLGEKGFCETLLGARRAAASHVSGMKRRCLYDVIDVEGTAARDERMRPNQILAISLPYCALPPAQMRAVVERCGRDLLTSYGLRSLGANEPGYLGPTRAILRHRCRRPHGMGRARLLGSFARAHFRVYGDARLAQSLLEPIAQHVNAACIGTVSESLMVTHLTLRGAASRRPGAWLRYCAHGFISSARSRRLKEFRMNIERERLLANVLGPEGWKHWGPI